MPISVSYGSQLSSVFGLRNGGSDGHSPVISESGASLKFINPNHGQGQTSPLLSPPFVENSRSQFRNGNEEPHPTALTVPGLEDSNVHGGARSSTSGSTLISPITPMTNFDPKPLPVSEVFSCPRHLPPIDHKWLTHLFRPPFPSIEKEDQKTTPNS